MNRPPLFGLPSHDDPHATAALLARANAAVSELSGLLEPLAALFAQRGESLYLVGGPVRDAMLGRLGNDLDFTTSARPEVIAEILGSWGEKTWDTGIEFGTVSSIKRGQQVEITTFRSDLYDGVTRNPEVTFGDTLEGDLVRRDFACNAMAIELSLRDGTLSPAFHDPVGGLDDILHRVLDTPQAPEISFRDDPLRMLRAARFASQLGFSVADRVFTAMCEMAGEINRITVERVQAELDKLMLGTLPWEGIDLLVETGIAQHILPEVPALQLETDEHMQHKDVYRHSLTVLRQATELEDSGPDLELRWAALMHDIGKPATRAVKEGGGVSFHHHEVVGAKMTRKRLRALKYPKHVIEDVGQLVYLHMRFHGFGEGQWTDSAVRRYVTDAGELLPKLHKLVRADSTTRNAKKAKRLQRTYDHLEERIDQIAAKEDLARVRPDLDGNEIMSILGLSPGPEVGKAWNFMKELRLERGSLEHDEAVAELKAWWESENA
ncbi:tRNA adenylyltransferase [Corynebacterium lipophiloflavum DSM 44291]|uniref:tRNA adenylyltransferase n=1 Tax=Corynebacterium lipophiloflavum (strain ATCC 700352 / DSM 44291 / CCUG 37336 / JCM 10383 / DMMZ 1944) TaxID=525263 RepID=C0XTG2_CORLD|nr:tRNA adenylyltransferase [Corynebacterium lipophiloflavum DSM 44291]